MGYVLNLAKDFSTTPGGRFYSDGPNSGEKFREEFLRRYLGNNQKLTIDLSGVYGFGSSFLEEAFGGLVRKGYFDAKYLRQHLEIISPVRTYSTKIWSYIDSARIE